MTKINFSKQEFYPQIFADFRRLKNNSLVNCSLGIREILIVKVDSKKIIYGNLRKSAEELFDYLSFRFLRIYSLFPNKKNYFLQNFTHINFGSVVFLKIVNFSWLKNFLGERYFYPYRKEQYDF